MSASEQRRVHMVRFDGLRMVLVAFSDPTLVEENGRCPHRAADLAMHLLFAPMRPPAAAGTLLLVGEAPPTGLNCGS